MGHRSRKYSSTLDSEGSGSRRSASLSDKSNLDITGGDDRLSMRIGVESEGLNVDSNVRKCCSTVDNNTIYQW